MAKPWRASLPTAIDGPLSGDRGRRRHLDDALVAAIAQVNAYLPLLPLRPIGRHVRHMDQGRADHAYGVVGLAGIAEREPEAEADTDPAAVPAAAPAAAAHAHPDGRLAIVAAALAGDPLAIDLLGEVDAAIRSRQLYSGYRLRIGYLHLHSILLTSGKAGDHRVCRAASLRASAMITGTAGH